ncbi:MAG: excinuclease ABC subunit UvrC [Rhizobiaceae bacterium]|nr:excinuclease ABC subunit UvrC [Rhizobiaceae bacterium]
MERTQADTVKAPADIQWDAAPLDDIAGLSGAELIAALARRLPGKPGVYRMFDGKGDVLYVGKAKNLKNRVTNYTRLGGHTNRIARMISETASMEFLTTRTETEALLLEANLIKRLRPRFNVLMRDDKSFPYIVLTTGHAAPGMFKHRGARLKGRDYFGPFASAGAVARTINALQRAFLLRTCTDSVFDARTRPCLLYQIKRCSAPCTGEISQEGYAELVNEARDFLEGRSQNVKKLLGAQMADAAEDLDFERAAVLRDRLAALSHVSGHQGINVEGLDEADVFAIHAEGGQTCIEVFFFRTGQNWGNHAFFPKADASIEPADVLGAFLAQFYEDKPVPRLILASHEFEDRAILAEALTAKAERKIEIAVPQRGDKRDLINHALANAKEALGRRLADTSSQRRLLEGVAELFGLPETPRRIEVFDNSHIMGTNAVGGMIVAGPEGFAKAHYRKFNIRNDALTPGDDFGMMKEVLERRFKRLIAETAEPDTGDEAADDAAIPVWPDLVVIDGGQGQFTAAKAIFDELGISDRVALVSIAKGQDREAGRERFFIAGKPSFSLPPRDPVLYFMQRLRDEAHRFAIGTHRAKRAKEMVKSPLDEIDGIGPARKRALLKHFGTAKAVSRAAVADLLAVDGVSQAMAQTIYDHFHGG